MLPFGEGFLAESAFHLPKFWQGDGRIDSTSGASHGIIEDSVLVCIWISFERKRVLFTMRCQLGRPAAISALGAWSVMNAVRP
jgi:hypothetical protein